MGEKNELDNKLGAISKSYFKIVCGGISGIFTSISIMIILGWAVNYQENMGTSSLNEPYSKIILLSGTMFIISLLLIQTGAAITIESKGILSKLNWLGIVMIITGMFFMIVVMGDERYGSINWIMLSISLLIIWFVVIMDIYYVCIFLFDKFKKLGDTEKVNIIIPVITLIIGAMLGNR